MSTGSRSSWNHFLIACGLLIATTFGWGAARQWLGMVTEKLPVPWPAGVDVDSGHRLLSLPDRLGPYLKLPARDGHSYGEQIFNEDQLESLQIASGEDNLRYASRRSNWYVSRVYEDTRNPARHRYWRLAIYYYTGGADLVPHIPDACLAAGGIKVQGTDRVHLNLGEANLPGEWHKPLAISRTRFNLRDSDAVSAEYYLFSLNGQPQADRDTVRLKLASPFMKYGYFAKIQFGPTDATEDMAQLDRSAAEFMKSLLPAVLLALPMPSDIEHLDKPSAAATAEAP